MSDWRTRLLGVGIQSEGSISLGPASREHAYSRRARERDEVDVEVHIAGVLLYIAGILVRYDYVVVRLLQVGGGE